MINMVPRVVSIMHKLFGTIMVSLSIVSTVSTHKSIKCHPVLALVRIRIPLLDQLRGLRCLKRLFFVQSVSWLSLIPSFSLFGFLLKDFNLFFQIGIIFLASM